jgi:hypothetical protein
MLKLDQKSYEMSMGYGYLGAVFLCDLHHYYLQKSELIIAAPLPLRYPSSICHSSPTKDRKSNRLRRSILPVRGRSQGSA